MTAADDLTASMPCWPIPGCEHPHPVDGCCTHPDAVSPECHPHACVLSTTRRLPLKGDMVAARRAGRKDVTRRVITRTNSTVDGERWGKKDWESLDLKEAWVDPACMGGGPCLKVPMIGHNTTHRVRPIYQPGDLLLMGEALELEAPKQGSAGQLATYAHDKALVEVDPALAVGHGWTLYGGKWLMWPWVRSSQPSIYCPADLVRDLALAVSCGPVRLQEISEEDASREGTVFFMAGGGEQKDEMSLRAQFSALWDRINGPRGHPWEANEFVWRLEMTLFGDELVKEVYGCP